MHEAFVYVWTNIENNMIYIGKHKGAQDDGYISSGKYFLAQYNQNPKLKSCLILISRAAAIGVVFSMSSPVIYKSINLTALIFKRQLGHTHL